MPRRNRGPYLERNKAGIYEIRFTVNGRSKRESTRTPDAAAAAAAFREWQQDVEREKAAAGVATVAGMLQGYWDEHVVPNVASRDGSAKVQHNNLTSHFGPLHPAEITPADVDAYVAKRRVGVIGGRLKRDPLTGESAKAGVQSPTIRRDLTHLISALNHAVKKQRLKRAEVPHIELPPENQPRERYLSEAEIARAFAAAAEISAERGRLCRIERWLHIALYTGRRKAAVEELDWRRVDFDLNVVDFDVPGRRKTKKRRGTAYMHPKLRACMERACAERMTGEDGEPSPWVLDHPGDLKAAFRVLRKRAGFGPDVTMHILKHTCATWMLRRGVSVWDVSGALATSAKTISDRYGKHVPEAQKAAMTALA